MITAPLGPFDPRYDPEHLASHPHATAEQFGWVKQASGAIARYRTLRSLTSIQKEVEVLRLFHQGYRHADIAEQLDVHPATVRATINRSMKRAVIYAGADKERNHQLQITDRVTQRLMQAIDPGVDPETGIEYPVNTKAVAELMKVLNRRAALTGADTPVKVNVEGRIDHVHAEDTVEKVNTYMDLMDRLMDTGYGSGRKREDVGELEVSEADRIIDAEVVEDDVSDDAVLSDVALPDTANTPISSNDPEVVAQSPPPFLHSVPNGPEPGGSDK